MRNRRQITLSGNRLFVEKLATDSEFWRAVGPELPANAHVVSRSYSSDPDRAISLKIEWDEPETACAAGVA